MWIYSDALGMVGAGWCPEREQRGKAPMLPAEQELRALETKIYAQREREREERGREQLEKDSSTSSYKPSDIIEFRF